MLISAIMTLNETNTAIEDYLDSLKTVLIKKNIAYNNSLHNANQLFFKGSKIDGVCARIDDKLNRIRMAGITGDTEDSIEDLIGYLVHLKIMKNE